MTKTVAEHMTWTRHHWTLTFFYCLLIALFVTVCIYTYAGEQQNLGTRKFSSIDVRGTQQGRVETVNVDDDTTIDLNPNRTARYTVTDGVTMVTLPTAGVLAQHFNGKVGRTINFGYLYNENATVATMAHASSGGIRYDAISTPNTTFGTESTTMTQHEVYNLKFTYHLTPAGDPELIWNPQ